MPGQKLIIDADPGIGDALTVALALVDPEIELLGLTACGGRVSGQQASQNLQTVVSLIDPPLWPRIGWSEELPSLVPRELGIPFPLLTGGPTGLGECESIAAPPHHRHDSAKVMIDLVKTHPEEIKLLTLGPLANVHMAIERCPEFLSMLQGVICLAGSVAAGGDVTAAAEFNVYADPEAARLIFTSPATKTLVPLDTASKVALTFEQYDRMGIDEYSRLGRLLARILPFALRESRTAQGRESLGLSELVALAAVSQPRLFTQEPMSVDVEVNGQLTRGMTVFDRRAMHQWQANIDVLTDVDAQGVLDYFSRLVRLAAQI